MNILWITVYQNSYSNICRNSNSNITITYNKVPCDIHTFERTFGENVCR